MRRFQKTLVLALALSGGGALVAKEVTVKDKLAAQIRTQGFACDTPWKQRATPSSQSQTMRFGF